MEFRKAVSPRNIRRFYADAETLAIGAAVYRFAPAASFAEKRVPSAHA